MVPGAARGRLGRTGRAIVCTLLMGSATALAIDPSLHGQSAHAQQVWEQLVIYARTSATSSGTYLTVGRRTGG